MDVDDIRCIFGTISGFVGGFFAATAVHDSLTFAQLVGPWGWALIGACAGGLGAISMACIPPPK